MVLDSEKDRAMLMDIIGSSTIQGVAVLDVAGLIVRVRDAKIVKPAAASEPEQASLEGGGK